MSVFLKRVFDVVCAAAGLVFLSPLLLWIAWRTRREDGGSVCYRGVRVGLHGKPFRIYKFRTMVVDAEKLGASSTSDDDPRITRIGKLLRKHKLDELPQLFNVLKGDMSLVGPRPLLMQYLDRYTPEQVRRHDVKPGMTGWAQVNGRNAITWEEKFEFDVWYVDNMSFWLDLKIIAITIWKIFEREGISQDMRRWRNSKVRLTIQIDVL